MHIEPIIWDRNSGEFETNTRIGGLSRSFTSLKGPEGAVTFFHGRFNAHVHASPPHRQDPPPVR